MNDPAFQELRALSALISSSLNTIENLLHSRGHKFPSLHEPYNADSEVGRLAPDVARACSTVVSAAGQLIAAVRTPFATARVAAVEFQTSSCLRTAIQLHVPEVLREAGSQGLHANEIAAVTSVDPTKLARVLRLLATNHVFVEVSPNVFAHNRISSVLDTGKSISEILHDPISKYDNTSGFAALVEQAGDIHYKASAFMYEALTDRSPQPGHHVGFNIAYRTSLPLVEWLNQPEQTYLRKRSDMAMAALRGVSSVADATDGLDWGALAPRSTVVDVAGGVGIQSLIFAQAYTQLNFIVQDKETNIIEAEKFWRSRMPEALHSGRVKLLVHNPFDPQPLKRPAVFYARMVLRSLSDDACVVVLRHLRDAAAPQTQLVVAETLVPYACADPFFSLPGAAANRSTPAPLLPNHGLAGLYGYLSDLTLMNTYNGTERTLPQVQKIVEEAGWKVMRVHRAGPAVPSKVIAVPMDDVALRLA